MEGMIGPQLIDRYANKLGIASSAIKSSFGGITSSLLGGISKKTNDPHAMGKLADLINESPDEAYEPRMLEDEGSSPRMRGQQLLSLASDDPSSMIANVGRSLGIGGGAAAGLVGTAVAAVMAGLRKLGRGRNLTGSTLGPLLRTELSGFGGATQVASTAAPSSEVGRTVATHTAAEIGVHHGRRAWWWLAVIPLAALLIWLLARPRHEHARVAAPTRPVPTMPTRPEPRPAPEVTPPPAPPTEAARRPEAPPRATMPQLAFPADSAEGQLLANIRSPDGENNKWYQLDQASFATGSATLDPASMDQLSHVAQILKAYPNVKVKIGGYTDMTGAAEANMKLSQDRADSVKQALVAAGIDPTRIDVEGYGETRPAEPTAGSSQANRRVAIEVTAR
ncbi:MAG TPA: OmpA family protein [Kofleriaceae bacterium]|nr:OmpA family protein [Kofleriaceae bacterium]